MSVGHGMIWPLAAEYARGGWAVRRAGWTSEITSPFNADNSLRWVVYHSGLFHLTYLSKSASTTHGTVTRVIQNTDFGVSEFLASDWTVFSTACGGASPDSSQQGKPPYPTPLDAPPLIFPPIDGTGTNTCVTVPPVFPPPDSECGACPPPPACGPDTKLATSGFDSCGCPTFLCQPIYCPNPPDCGAGKVPKAKGFNSLGCAIWECGDVCAPPPECGANTTLVNKGNDAKGCPSYLCQPTYCGDPPECPPGKTLTITEATDNGCPSFACLDTCGPCLEPQILCPPISTLVTSGPDICGCMKSVCVGNGCPPPPLCPPGAFLFQIGIGADGCGLYVCSTNPPPPPPPPPPRPWPPPPPPQTELKAATITIENVTYSPECFLDNTAPPFQIQLGFRVTLGPAPSPETNGLYWVSVYAHGKKVDAPTMTPGQSIDYSVAVQQDLGKPVLIRANAYLPLKRVSSRDQHEFTFPDMCEEEPCCNPDEDGVQCGDVYPCCCPYAYAPVGENCACEYVGT
jgi:hypothetical protein